MAVMGPSFLSFKLLPPVEVRDELVRRVQAFGWYPFPAFLFDLDRWHQSVSCRFEERAGWMERMLRAGDRVNATAFSLGFDRVAGKSNGKGRIQWAFGIRGKSRELGALVKAVHDELQHEGIDDPTGHTAHITISYRAPRALKEKRFAPVIWPIRELLLIRGGGDLAGYEKVASWPLRPHPQRELW